MYSNSILSPSHINMNLSTIQFVIYSHPLTKSEPNILVLSIFVLLVSPLNIYLHYQTFYVDPENRGWVRGNFCPILVVH